MKRIRKILQSSGAQKEFERAPRFWMGMGLLGSDLISITVSEWLALTAWKVIGGNLVEFGQFLRFFPLIFVVLASLYGLRGLYPGIGLNRVVELKRLVTTTVFGYSLILALLLLFRSVNSSNASEFIIIGALSFGLIPFNAGVFVITGVLSFGLIPFSRWFVRGVLIYLHLWGEPVIVFGLGEESKKILDHLRRFKKLGWRAVAVVSGSSNTEEQLGIPIISGTDWLQDEGYAAKYQNVQTAIISYQEISGPLLSVVVNNQLRGFSRLIFLSGWEYLRKAWVTPVDLGGLLGLEVRQNLLNPRGKILKRLLDLTIVLAGAFLGIPLLLLLLALVLVDSKGKPFYKQTRIGFKGENFSVWKFRTMVSDADAILAEYLAAHPELKAEWEETHKLKNDPRITGLGKILRKLSLDEIPQIWNVLKGEMSLVGPRPIVEKEIERYQDVFTLYKQVKPGITGMWQVSGRNDTGYKERIRFDEYYVRNWSIWLDLYILVRTIWVVIRRRGAY